MHVALVLLGTLTGAARLPAAPALEWAEFRGPDGTGRYDGLPLVTEWGPDKNVAWKASVPGRGWSSPVIAGGKVFLTTAVKQGDAPKPDLSLRALAFDAATGKQLWDVEVFAVAGKDAPGGHSKNSQASPTPVTDGERVIVHFGHLGTAALDPAGKILWKTQEHKYSPVHGNGGSPILVGDLAVFSADGADKQFVLALDKTTGNVKWKADRKTTAGKRFSFATPQVIASGGRQLIFSPASGFAAALDPKDGSEVWRAAYPVAGYSVIPRPIVAAGRLVLSTGYDSAHLLAVEADGSGTVAWDATKGAPHTPTPLAVGDDVYAVSDAGILTCFDAKTGKAKWTERLKGKGYSASPILVNGLVYLTSEDGVGQVVKPGPAFEAVGGGEMKEKTFATPAAAGGGLFVRTETALYKFNNP